MRSGSPPTHLRARVRRARHASSHLLVGAVSGALAFLGIVGLSTSLVLVGLVAAPWVLARLRQLAMWERERAGRWLGVWVPEAYRPLPTERHAWSRAVARTRDPQTWRDLAWLVGHALTGYLVAAVVCLLWVLAAASWISIPAYFVAERMWPGEQFAYQGIPVAGPVQAVLLPLVGTAVAAALVVLVVPKIADGLARLAAALLAPSRGLRLQRRIDDLARTRTDTVEAQATELQRIERDLHDGVQARLTSVAMRLGLLEQQLADDSQALRLASDARVATEDALTELRIIVRTMYPPILTDRGLSGALVALAAQGPVPIQVDEGELPDLPPSITSAAYHVVAEALTNVSRHSRATTAAVRLRFGDGHLEVVVADDGIGGANAEGGSGLDGLRRRVAALDGKLAVDSPDGRGTTIRATLPVTLRAEPRATHG
jgi:signal transduction histidine kinase